MANPESTLLNTMACLLGSLTLAGCNAISGADDVDLSQDQVNNGGDVGGSTPPLGQALVLKLTTNWPVLEHRSGRTFR
jgi:hypothetical protein